MQCDKLLHAQCSHSLTYPTLVLNCHDSIAQSYRGNLYRNVVLLKLNGTISRSPPCPAWPQWVPTRLLVPLALWRSPLAMSTAISS
jgi:hypothetical protein